MKNLYLLGFMGTGKSTLGKALAKQLNMSFLDSDLEIEKLTQTSIAEIFKNQGEPYFRRLEEQFLQSHPKTNCIISCGGGMITLSNITKILSNLGVAICLKASPQTILERIKTTATRPLLNTSNPLKTIETLLEERTPLYNKIPLSINTDNQTIEELVEKIINIYRALPRTYTKIKDEKFYL